MLSLDDLARRRDRPINELTRRDLARALLEVPAADARQHLATLASGCEHHGLAVSPAFWRATDALLSGIEHGTATQGDVARWLEATGTQPAAILGLLVWDDEGNRGFIAEDVYRGLVAHLEALVDEGLIDPDALLAGDEEEWARWRSVQLDWLDLPYDGERSRMDAVIDEEDHEFLDAWAQADAANVAWFDRVVERVPCPEEDLATECARLRETLLEGEAWWPAFLLAAAGLTRDALPAEDRDLYVSLAAGSLVCQDEPPGESGLSDEEQAAWMALDSGELAVALAGLLQSGVGTRVTAMRLGEWVVEDLGDDDADTAVDAFGDGYVADDYAFGFSVVVRMWESFGVIRDGRLTSLGRWALPEAMTHAHR